STNPADYTGTSALAAVTTGQTTLVCVMNRKEPTRHVTLIKQVDNVPGDTTPFLVSDNAAALPGDISGSGDKIEETIDALSHTFHETLATGYSFVDAFESDEQCNPIEG